MSPSQPSTWADLAFGLPTYTPPLAAPGGTVTVRRGLDRAVVPDGARALGGAERTDDAGIPAADRQWWVIASACAHYGVPCLSGLG
jgi:hypothetical protein